jgi:uncharacterized protein (UPF0335 family)
MLDILIETEATTTADELRQFIERYEHLAEEKTQIAEDQKQVMLEAKSRGFDAAALKKIVAMRKKNRDELAEEQAILETYMSALGMV